MINGIALKERINAMTDEELRAFNVYMLTDKATLNDMLNGIMYDIEFTNDTASTRGLDCEDAVKLVPMGKMCDILRDTWSNAHADEDDPYGFGGAWDTLIADWHNELFQILETRFKTDLLRCKDCHGTGYLKSYCDEPDRKCPSCNGSGERLE